VLRQQNPAVAAIASPVNIPEATDTVHQLSVIDTRVRQEFQRLNDSFRTKNCVRNRDRKHPWPRWPVALQMWDEL
jgi:hypothetical protein